MNYFILQVRTGSFPTFGQYSDYLIGRLQGYIQVRRMIDQLIDLIFN